MTLEEWKRWILDTTYDNGRYWTMHEKTPLPVREQAVNELAAEGKLVMADSSEKNNLIEWRLP